MMSFMTGIAIVLASCVASAPCEPRYADADGDGFGGIAPACDGVDNDDDCDDTRADVFPGAPETCADDTDRDCDGRYGGADGDGDGWSACLDCDDGNADVHPTAPEACGDVIDTNCDGVLADADMDGDGVGRCTDCDDARADVHPGAVEACGEVDDLNCDGRVADDADADGWLACEDCDDGRSDVHPTAIEVCDGEDKDCDGVWEDPDRDCAACAFQNLPAACDLPRVPCPPASSRVEYPTGIVEDCVYTWSVDGRPLTEDCFAGSQVHHRAWGIGGIVATCPPTPEWRLLEDWEDRDGDGLRDTGSVETCTPSDDGRVLTCAWDRVGSRPTTTVTEYDAAGRRVRVTRTIHGSTDIVETFDYVWGPGTLEVVGPPDGTEEYTFDRFGQRTWWRDWTGVTTHTYADVAGCPRLVAARLTDNGSMHHDTDWTYDVRGRPSTRSFYRSDGSTFTHYGNFTRWTYDDSAGTVLIEYDGGEPSHGACVLDGNEAEWAGLEQYDVAGNLLAVSRDDPRDATWDANTCMETLGAITWDWTRTYTPTCP